jgi:hypothetical protein
VEDVEMLRKEAVEHPARILVPRIYLDLLFDPLRKASWLSLTPAPAETVPCRGFGLVMVWFGLV